MDEKQGLSSSSRGLADDLCADAGPNSPRSPQVGIHIELREAYPDWARITPAKRRILEYLTVSGGEVQYWPGDILRSTAPLRKLEFVGFVESWQRAEDRYRHTRITEDGAAALSGGGSRAVQLGNSGKTK